MSSQVKFAEVQLLEIVFACDLFIIAAWFALHPAPLKIFRPFWDIGMRWGIFSVLAILLAVYGLQQDFFPGATVSVLKLPFVVTLSRIAELFLDVFYMLYLADAYRNDERLRRFAAFAYYWVGMAGAVYAIVSECAMVVGIKLGGATASFRTSGFNNEGGSYGTYLLTVILIVAVMRSQRWITRRAAIVNYVFLGITLAASRSKAALFEVVVFALMIPVLRLRGIRLAVVTASLAMLLSVAWFALNVPALLAQYTVVADQYQAISATRPDDYNVVAGRIAGLYLAPKMIAAHPIAGIGLGNYPIIRDDPAYRQGTPIVAIGLDSPSLGPIDYVVDLGIPLFLYLTWAELAPAFLVLKLRKSSSLICLLLMQPVANWFGAHLNLTYPWVAAGIALGIAYATAEPAPHEQPSRAHGQPSLGTLETTP